MILSKFANAGRKGFGLMAAVLTRALRCVDGVRKGLTSSSLVSLQAALLMLNVCILTAAIKARKRAEFVTAVKFITDLDERSLRLILGYIPAWVKFSEYERARFLNDSLQMLWPAFDRAICNLLKAELEPLLQANAPAAVAGCYFDSLSFGSTPIQIVGIKNSTFRTGADQLGIVLDIDLRWAGTPDLTLKLLPSRKWVLKVLPKTKGIDLTPEMHVAFNTLHVAGMLRVTLTPIVQDIPFVGGVSLSWLEMPMVDFDVRGLGGADLMSMPAVAEWIMTSLVQGYIANMVWPKQVTIPFMRGEELEQWQAPLGMVTVEVMEAALPPRLGAISRKEKPLHPYAAVVVGAAGTDVGAETGPNVQAGTTSTVWNTKEPRWGPQEAFHLCVYDAHQVVKIVLAHNMEGGSPAADLTLGRVDIPLSMLVAPVAHARRNRLSGSLLAASQAHQSVTRARHRLHSPRKIGRVAGLRGGAARGGSARGSISSSIAGDSVSGAEEGPAGGSPRGDSSDCSG
eukprot:CAMPEP_0206148526 /NCGR_PEP_ID=MMETSP1473-20131121/36862_1 /ASSEMBLY_ACC=CAM_ASM_001109 /TAXON_ID=1461547 /ORGANISM="Stichococcus sp, Strain RCC1054" /LENGTH=511 /DNA_ID=CAMNT_0053545887 /DNA_START=207 /DNA_END=1739 /DNA_ORIENTATION=-